jgi:hypothetical protein
MICSSKTVLYSNKIVFLCSGYKFSIKLAYDVEAYFLYMSFLIAFIVSFGEHSFSFNSLDIKLYSNLSSIAWLELLLIDE